MVQEGGIEARDDKNNTPLILAAEGGHLKVVKLLLRRGADVEGKDESGWTALHWAALWGIVDIVRQLVENGAQVDCRDERKCTPLHLSAFCGHLDLADDHGENDLGNAAAADIDYVHIICLLLERGADIDCWDNKKNTPLFLAAECGRLVVVKLLVEKGAGIKNRNEDGWTLFIAPPGRVMLTLRDSSSRRA
ncbi:hypothetical protein HDU96_003365 [Phlyctochytrium bullatum]|nr:hypothetical protein HDU96_003365 [Phlyctochytrium bullatum]